MRRLIDRSASGALVLGALALFVLLSALLSAVAPRVAAASGTTAASGTPAGSDSVAHRHEQPVVLAPGYADLSFEPPAAGSYRLPPLGAAVDGPVIDSSGRTHRLHELFDDRLVVLSFIYTTCPDVNGCPLATHVFSRVADRIAESETLGDQVRLISLSFDPDQDTAEVMAAYGKRFERAGVDWRFLTTPSVAALDPLLEAYDQWVIRDHDEQGRPLGSMSHVLRVYLIDRSKRIRNIYSVSFLHADTVTRDIETLLMDSGGD